MAFPLLPPLKKDGDGLAVLPKTGTWIQVPGVALNNIADNLQVTKVDAKFIDIDSIPSMWARPLLFEIALYDKDHPMHDCVVGEWRGLLTMLALKEQRKFRLETKLITIPDEDDGKAPELLKALHKLLPQRTLDDAGTTWDKLYLILLKGKPIGMTSPTSLVFTSIDYIKHITVNDVPWYAPPFLCDPIPHLNDSEKTSVAGWLNDFHKNTITPLPDSPIKSNLAPRILDFIKSLGGAPDGQPKFTATPLGMNVGIFKGMNFPIAPKEYFTEKLFVICRSDAFLKQNVLLPAGSDTLKDVNGAPVTPILPIAKELLNDFSIDELSNRIAFATTPNGIEVSLQLPSPDGGPDFAISRVYINQKDGNAAIFDKYEIVEIPYLPVLEIWPNFRTPGWQVYYTYFNKAQQDTFYVEPFPTDGNPEDTKITKTSVFPEVMICKYKSEDAGFLFIKAPPVIVPDGAKTWDVGIDFGTSSTTVYKTELPDGAGPEPVTLKDRLLQITDSGDPRIELQNDFLSYQDEETPLFSLFQENSIGIPLDDRIKPLLDGRIYFVDDPELPQNVISNLKWSPEPIDRKRTQAYLEQICLQCAAEAAESKVSKINWRFSYPIAFSPANKLDFEGICQATIDDVIIETGDQQTVPVSLESESIVTAKFFGGQLGGFANGAVCIDIGGETSDISIWQDNTLRWQTSIRFAGRHIFLDLLKHKPTFLRDVGVTEQEIPALRNPNDFYSQADALIDASINTSPKDLKAKFGIYGGKIEATPFVPLIGLGISGLFYYVGLILNYLSREPGFGKTMPNIYIGGNGSRILHWLANGEFKPDSASCGPLKDILLTASGFDPKSLFDLEITPNPKHEAAAGLVDQRTILKSTERQFDFLAGEVFTQNGKDYEWTELLTAERLGKGLRSGDKLVEIETFIEKFNAGLGKERICFNAILKHKLISGLNSNLQNLAFTSPRERIVEPLFILVLKDLLKRETAAW
ncbi:MAG: hypothetical protein OXI43_13345 [Candidatus Poribacteria bacterium]|nr:hypothetical protein [Candidatus Poribacteria bacterium]